MVFISVLSEIASKHGAEAIVLLSRDELREIKAKADKKGTNLPRYLLGDVKSLQFCLKNLQEKDYSNSMVVSTLRPFMSQILEKNGDTRIA